jgi:membrane protease YdiL (CAAX protease family)
MSATLEAAPARKPWRPRPWLTLLRAVVFAGVLPALLFILFIAGGAGVVAFYNAHSHATGSARWRLPAWVVVVVSLAVTQLSLLATAWWRGRVEGDGNRPFNLGLLPIRRPGLLVALVPLTEIGLIVWVVLLRRLVHDVRVPGVAELVHGFTGAPLVDAAIALFAIGLLPATCEELFFRGWLWGSLRRSWPPLTVGCVTTLLWLLPHALDGGIVRPLFLLPIGVSLACARHFCGSVRASWVIHLVNNLAVVGFVLGLHG